MRPLILVTLIFTLGHALSAQTPTLRERIAAEQTDIALTVSVDHPPAVFVDVLQETELIVRAIIGRAVSFVSHEGRDVHTYYELLNPQVFFSPAGNQSSRPKASPPALSFTQRGGTVRIDGFTATVASDGVAKLSTGMDVIVFLRPDNGQYRIARDCGIFEVRDSVMVPLVDGAGEHRKFAGMKMDAFVAEVTALRQALQTK